LYGKSILKNTRSTGGDPTNPNDVVEQLTSSYGKHHLLMSGWGSDGLSGDCFAEQFADSVSMVSFKNKSDKNNAQINCGGNLFFPGDVKNYEEYVKADPTTYVVDTLLFEEDYESVLNPFGRE
jgi:hypothetical protein